MELLSLVDRNDGFVGMDGCPVHEHSALRRPESFRSKTSQKAEYDYDPRACSKAGEESQIDPPSRTTFAAITPDRSFPQHNRLNSERSYNRYAKL